MAKWEAWASTIHLHEDGAPFTANDPEYALAMAAFYAAYNLREAEMAESDHLIAELRDGMPEEVLREWAKDAKAALEQQQTEIRAWIEDRDDAVHRLYEAQATIGEAKEWWDAPTPRDPSGDGMYIILSRADISRLEERDKRMKSEGWAEAIEYVKTELREDFKEADKPLAKYPKPIGNSLVQPCRDAVDASDGPWGYQEYEAHIATVQISSALDMLTIHPAMDVNGEHWDRDEDPNPYLDSARKGPSDD